MSARRVVVTGLGVVSPLAVSAPEHFRRLLDGESRIERLAGSPFGNYPPILQSRVAEFDPREWVPDRMLRKLLSPSPAMALGSATEALRDGNVPAEARVDCGLYVGSVCLDVNPEALIPALRESINDQNLVDLHRFASRGMKLVDPLFLVKSLPNAGLCAIAIQHQVLGPNANFTNGTISGMQAVNAAVEAIRAGGAVLALAGGYDTLLQMDCVVEHLLGRRLARLKDVPSRSCRPFRPDSDGYALGEGAAFLLLESLEHAVDRGARIYGEILAFGEASAPADLLDPSDNRAEALIVAADRALRASGIFAEALDVVFGDGVALPVDDAREVAAFEAVAAGARGFTAATPALGFTGAASGPFSLIHALLSFRAGVAPPLINCDGVAADHPLPVVRSRHVDRVHTALVWNSDRGIKNAAMVVAAMPE